MQSYSIALYEAEGQTKWSRNLYLELIMVVNSNDWKDQDAQEGGELGFSKLYCEN
jgi:hypothetical protein